MRFGHLEFTGQEPFGAGSEKIIFVDPDNPNRVIAQRKEGRENESIRQLKGRAYLTKIVHLLLPDHIPDVYQAGEDREGKQIVIAQRIAHTPGHTHAQELRKRSNRTTQEENEALEQIFDELGAGYGSLNADLEHIGFKPTDGFDENPMNYTKSEDGNVYYLETFKPWRIRLANPNKIQEVLFDKKALGEAIEQAPDETTKVECNRYLKRLLVLLEEETQEL